MMRSRAVVLVVAMVMGVVAGPGAVGAGVAGAGVAGAGVAGASDAAGDQSFSVLTHNIYLGADIGLALDLVPDLKAAAQAMWDQVQATDFAERAPALAAIVNEVDPAVIGLQEVARWLCTPDDQTEPVAVVDFTTEYLAAAAATGTGYVVASANGAEAVSPGFSIAPLVGATVVTAPEVFGPLFGVDEASCGFAVEDVVLVRSDLAGSVVEAGFVTYDTVTSLIPGFIEVARGFAYADVTIDGVDVRFVSTHLESARPDGEDPPSALQARELVNELAGVSGPVVVMGDFNAGPASELVGVTCEGRGCNSYLTMLDGGFTDAGPDATDPANSTFGAGNLLAGADDQRAAAGLAAGNPVGFTSRLDYVLVAGDVAVDGARVVGNQWPQGVGVWACDNPAQLAANEAYAAVLSVDAPAGGACFASDHAAVAATLTVAGGAAEPDVATGVAGVADADAAGAADGGSSMWWLAAVVAVVAVAGGGAVWLRKRRN